MPRPRKNKRQVHDNEEIIRLVRERPAVYDIRDPLYKDHVKKERAWLEVARIYYETWDSLSATERSEKCKCFIYATYHIAASIIHFSRAGPRLAEEECVCGGVSQENCAHYQMNDLWSGI